MGLAWVFLPESLFLFLEDDISIAHFLKKVNRFEEKIFEKSGTFLGGRHLTFCVDIGVCLCYTIIVPKGTERRKKKMRATGIVRRLDDLGRWAIPKEIRRVLGWKEGDPLELYFDKENKTIVLKKYETEEEEE